jgi:hypothetical protein
MFSSKPIELRLCADDPGPYKNILGRGAQVGAAVA